MNDHQDLQLTAETEPVTFEPDPSFLRENQLLKTIHIDRRGFLSLTRKSYQDLCFCPYASKDMTIRCGTWCPMFGEPYSVLSKPYATGSYFELRLSCSPQAVIKAAILDDARQ